jgi:hypothetical protein
MLSTKFEYYGGCDFLKKIFKPTTPTFPLLSKEGDLRVVIK